LAFNGYIEEVFMTQLKKRALWSLLIWGVVLTAIVIIFFSGGGSTAFLEGESKNTLTRVFVSIGFILYFLMHFLTRVRAGAKPLVKDERDELIEKRSFSIGFYTLLGYVFFLCSFLYGFYKGIHEIKLISVGWMWFLALSSVFLGFISNAVATLVLDARMSGHGES
jgi:hypothetical protein